MLRVLAAGAVGLLGATVWSESTPATTVNPIVFVSSVSAAGFRVVNDNLDETALACFECHGCFLRSEHCMPGPQEDGWESPHAGCEGSSKECDGFHPSCIVSSVLPDRESTKRFVDSFTEATPLNAVILLVAYKDVAMVNTRKQAVQILGCNNVIQYEIPVDDAQWDAIEAGL